MKNAVGREIPEEILKITGKEPFQGNNYLDGKIVTKAGPTIRPVMIEGRSPTVAESSMVMNTNMNCSIYGLR